MPELDVGLLIGVLRFVARTLDRTLATTTDPEALLGELLGAAPTAAQLTQLATVHDAMVTDITEAGAALTDVKTALATAASPSDVKTAATAATRGLSMLARAVGRVAPTITAAPVDAGMQVLVRAGAAGADFSGLVAQLGLAPAGLTVADSITVAGTLIMCTLGNPAERRVDPAGLFTLHTSRLDGQLDWSQPGKVSVKLSTGLRAGVTSDPFVAMLVGHRGSVDTTVTVSVDPTNGVTFGPGTKHRVAIAGRLDAGGYVDLHDFTLSLPDASELASTSTPPGFALTAAISGKLGPIAVVVDGLGVALTIDPDAVAAGTPNPAALTAVPPTGAGVSINAGPVHGGGYLMHRGSEYGGALDLALGPVEIKAFGLIDTDPFSLVVVLSVQFTPAIQLSFGFTLNGVGGLLALERTIATEALAQGMRTHAIDDLLFPSDPVAIAPRLMTMLEADFPAAAGGFVVGPMVELGWGEPISFVTAQLGVLLALPDPKIVILGALRVALPDPALPIVDLRAELVGEITPEHLLILVSLAGSKLAGFSLSGDFGILIGYGSVPELAITAGGFHPHYQPPAELTGLQRVSIDLSPPAILSMQARAYVALTSNSVQLGAFVQVRADVAVARAEGHIGFDAIVRWAPRFSFEIDLDAGFSVSAFGVSFASVDLRLHLEGPGPWLAHGTATVSLLFFDADIDVGPLQWGDADNPPPDSRSPVQLVVDELGKPGSWRPVAPDQGDRVATLAEATVEHAVLVHPLGAFEVRQHAVPLETVIDRIGPHAVTEHRVNLTAPIIGTNPVAAVSHTMDRFAPGQFLTLSDDEKLSRPAFEDFPSGARFAGVAQDTLGTAVESPYRWNTVYPHRVDLIELKELFLLDRGLLRSVIAGAAAARNRVATANAYLTDTEPVRFAPAGTVTIRSTRDLTPIAGLPDGPLTTTAAARLVAVTVGTDLSDAAQLVGPGVSL